MLRGINRTAPGLCGIVVAGLVAVPSSAPPVWGPSVEGSWETPDGESVYYACYGDGAPVIILEAGTDTGASQAYDRTFLEPLAERTTTCVYDRLGTGRSDPPLDESRTVDDARIVLEGLLAEIGVPAPYVLVGQSGGGNAHILFAAHHADEVAGLVLIEAYHDDPEAMAAFADEEGFEWTDNPEHVDWYDGSVRLDELPLPLGDFPVLVMTATHADEGNVENQAYWLGISPTSEQVVLEGGHDLHMDDPDAVTGLILDMLDGIGGSHSDREPSEPGGRIVFSRPVPGGGSQLFTVNPDGTDERLVEVPDLNEDFGRGTWSPDGEQLLFSNVFVFDQGGEITGFRPAVALADGTDFRVLELPGLPMDMYCTAWSPDSDRVLCGMGGEAMWSFATDGDAESARLTTNPTAENDVPVGYSPDGTALAFQRFNANETVALFLVEADGSNERRLTDDEVLLAHELASAAWAPHGVELISSTRDGEIVTIAADGSGVEPIELDLGDGDYFAFNPSYSPDGSRIVFAAQLSGAQPDIYTADPDGSNVVQVTDSDGIERFPSWGPAAVPVGTETPAATASDSTAAPPSEPGATYTSSNFAVPFEVTLPGWVASEPAVEESNFVTWESSSDDRAIRFLAPVSVYPPGSTSMAPVPDDYVDYLLDQTNHGANFSEVTETTIGGLPATVVTGTTASGIDGGLGCQSDVLPPSECFGVQPGYLLRLAVVEVGDQVLLIWQKDPNPSQPDYAPFEAMLASLRFPGAVVTEIVETTATAGTTIVGSWYRTQSCEEMLAVFDAAGLAESHLGWLQGNFFAEGTGPAEGNVCEGSRGPLEHSHFFTEGGGFGSHDENGNVVDDGDYEFVDDDTLAFPSHASEFRYDGDLTVDFTIDGDVVTFDVVLPDSCDNPCKNAYAWALSAFASGPWTWGEAAS